MTARFTTKVEWFDYSKYKPEINTWCLVAVKRDDKVFTLTGNTYLFYGDTFHYHCSRTYQDVQIREEVLYWTYLPQPIDL